MDGSRFDAWTRRRFGLAAGGLAGVLVGLAGRDDATTKKRKKRCKKFDQECKPSGKKRRCCTGRGLQCHPDIAGRIRCCRKGGESCSDDAECCSFDCGPEGQCLCKTPGQPCGEDRHCCSFNCEGSECA